MKKLVTLISIVFNSILVAQEPMPFYYALEEPMVIGVVDKSDRISMEVDKEKLLKTINHYMSGSDLGFDSAHIDTIYVDRERFYFLVFKTKQSNKTLVRWLSRKGTDLILENTQENGYKPLNTYFTCEGEQSCYPRLQKMKDQYYWNCRDVDGCVSEAYAEAHPCKCTKSMISK